jgi:hypothetical protein
MNNDNRQMAQLEKLNLGEPVSLTAREASVQADAVKPAVGVF